MADIFYAMVRFKRGCSRVEEIKVVLFHISGE
jgi:hypothetical protein